MPRPRSPLTEAHRSAQERYRLRLKEIRRPEAQSVDWAVTAAFAVALSRVREGGESNPLIETIVADSKAILLGDGYAPNEVVRKLMARLLFRDDLATLTDLTVRSI